LISFWLILRYFLPYVREYATEEKCFDLIKNNSKFEKEKMEIISGRRRVFLIKGRNLERGDGGNKVI
jgi:hypothetical protein